LSDNSSFFEEEWTVASIQTNIGVGMSRVRVRVRVRVRFRVRGLVRVRG
jgi:hypothetical protein